MTAEASFSEVGRSSPWVRRAGVGACLLAMAAILAVPVSRNVFTSHPAQRSAYDYDYTRSTSALSGLQVPQSFREVADRPGCTESEVYVRCFVTTVSRPDALAYLHATVGPAVHDNSDGTLRPGWTACGDLLGVPAVGTISRDPINAVKLSPGSWRFPREGLQYSDRLSVSIQLANHPHCTSSPADG